MVLLNLECVLLAQVNRLRKSGYNAISFMQKKKTESAKVEIQITLLTDVTVQMQKSCHPAINTIINQSPQSSLTISF